MVPVTSSTQRWGGELVSVWLRSIIAFEDMFDLDVYEFYLPPLSSKFSLS